MNSHIILSTQSAQKVIAAILGFTFNIGAAAVTVANPSFETASAWTYSENDPYGKFGGGYSSAWASEGSSSYVLSRGTGFNGGGGWWGQIQQTGINLSGVNTLLLDIHAIGVDANALRIYVDSTKVADFYVAASTWGGVKNLFDKSVDISGFTGLHTLTIRMTSDGDTSPADPKYYYIDNLRTLPVPEPASYLMFALGALTLAIRRYGRYRVGG